MNPDALLTRLRLEPRYLIDIDKKLHELEYLLPGADPVQFLDAAKRTALLSERSTAQLRSFLFTIYGGMPQDYYLQAAEKEMGKAAARALKEAIKDIPAEQVYDAVFEDPILQMDFIYFSEYYEPKMFLDRMLSRWEQYKDDINR